MALASYGEARAPRRAARGVTPPATAASAPSRVDWATLAKRARRGEPGPQDHADLAASVQRASRRCCSSWPAGCTTQPADRVLTMAGGVALNCVANTRICRRGAVRGRLGAAGRRRRRAPRWAAPCTSPPTEGDRSADARRRPRPRLDRRRARGLAADRAIAVRAAGRPRRRGRRGAGRRRRRRLVPGPQRVRPARARAPVAARPTPAAANLERLNDVKGREQFRPVAPMVLAERPRGTSSTRPAAQPVHALRARRGAGSGGTGSRRSSTSTAPPGSRPSTAPTSRWWPACWSAFEARPGCRWWSTPASTPPAGRWSTTRGTPWSASAPPRSTCWPSARSWSAGGRGT